METMNTETAAARANELLAIELSILRDNLAELQALPGLKAERRALWNRLRTCKVTERAAVGREMAALQSRIEAAEDLLDDGIPPGGVAIAIDGILHDQAADKRAGVR